MINQQHLEKKTRKKGTQEKKTKNILDLQVGNFFFVCFLWNHYNPYEKEKELNKIKIEEAGEVS